MSFSRAFQWYHSHLDPIWPDGTFKGTSKYKVDICIPVKGTRKYVVQARYKVQGTSKYMVDGCIPAQATTVLGR